MCSGSKSNLSSLDSEMEAGFQENNKKVAWKNCSKLLELAATDALADFVHEVEVMGSDLDEASLWYGRRFGSKKMGFEERTPIMIASMFGSIEVLKYILETGKVDVNRACGLDGATALHCAAAGGSWASVDIVKLLVDASGDVNVVDADGKKPWNVVAPCVKSTSNSKRKMLEMMLRGLMVEDCVDEENDGGKTPRIVKDGTEKKEYPNDVSLPDINDGIYGTDEFRMYSFKVKTCARAYSHDWTECPFVHPGENARRRDLRKFQYSCVPCPEFKKGSCARGDACEYAHGVFESWLHPAQYKTRLCKDEMGCARKVCFFAHKAEELRPVYASTGSAIPSPKSVSVNSLDVTALSSLSLGSSTLKLPNTSTPPASPLVSCSSPTGGSMWQNKFNLATPPVLQLPGSRLKAALSARDVDLEMELLALEQIRSQHQRQQLVEEMASLSSPYARINDLKPTNLDNVFGSFDPSRHSPTSHQISQNQNQISQNQNQLRASYPSNFSPSPARNPSTFGFDSSAAVAAAVMNSRSSAFSNRSQSFIDRSGVKYRYSLSGSANSPCPTPSKHSDWSSPDRKVDWGFNGDDAKQLRKSASFGFRSNNANASAAMVPSNVNEPDISWVHSLVKDVPSGTVGPYDPNQMHRGIHDVISMPPWADQMHIELEEVIA